MPQGIDNQCVPHGAVSPVDYNDKLDWRNEDVKTMIQVVPVLLTPPLYFFSSAAGVEDVEDVAIRGS